MATNGNTKNMGVQLGVQGKAPAGGSVSKISPAPGGGKIKKVTPPKGYGK